jgi:hypothetical protein
MIICAQVPTIVNQFWREMAREWANHVALIWFQQPIKEIDHS